MTAIKETSTIQENKKAAAIECPVTYIMERIGGYWKPIILFQLMSGEKRYNEIRKAIPPITEKMLIQNLRQLEAENLVSRQALAVVPPHVTYSLTDSGNRLRKVLHAMADWVIQEAKLNEIPVAARFDNFPEVVDNWTETLAGDSQP